MRALLSLTALGCLTVASSVLAQTTPASPPPPPPSTLRAPTPEDLRRGEYGRYRANNDLRHYVLDVRVDPEAKTIAGTSAASYSDWKLGLTRNFDHGYAVALGYYDTNARRSVYTNAMGHYLGRATAVVSASKAF